MRLAPNVGATDKIIRYVIGGLLVGVAIYYKTWWPAVVGIILALTAAVGRCAIYYLLGITTRRTKESP